ncbi:succinate dehydrogenase assembly factor 2 [Geovibrio thiophilus]|uniref:FAD assembly factor SdhE n=1 Tax=Geovibrio thiophilus TaxID=139438 RepID=A0A3R5Y5V8_9BACT|nr:succinate dehydrogenase assembly factor 2 [Geovibrio thiophilus]QAR32414.1 succinate dehydrogenase assembly factor 2 [Geovibrio thiophilus]
MKDSPLFKKAIFLAARRAMLENEMIVREFVEHNLPEYYTEKDMEELCELLLKIFDNDLFDVIMGQKTAEQFEGQYNVRLLKDIEKYAALYRENKKTKN